MCAVVMVITSHAQSQEKLKRNPTQKGYKQVNYAYLECMLITMLIAIIDCRAPL